MSKELKKAVLKLLNDINTLETVVIEAEADAKFGKLTSYSSIEQGRDSVNFINSKNKTNYSDLHSRLVKTSLQGRKAYWNFLIKAIN